MRRQYLLTWLGLVVATGCASAPQGDVPADVVEDQDSAAARAGRADEAMSDAGNGVLEELLFIQDNYVSDMAWAGDALYVCGTAIVSDPPPPEGYPPDFEPPGYYHYFVAKYVDDELAWRRDYKAAWQAGIRTIRLAVDGEGGVWLGGNFAAYFSGEGVDLEVEYDGHFWHGTGSAFVVQLSGDGEVLFARHLAESMTLKTWTEVWLAASTDGDVYVLLQANGLVDFGGQSFTSSGEDIGELDVYLAKLGPLGSHRWSQQLGRGIGRGLAPAPAGGLVVSAWLNTLPDGVTPAGDTGAGVVLAYNASGDLAWARQPALSYVGHGASGRVTGLVWGKYLDPSDEQYFGIMMLSETGELDWVAEIPKTSVPGSGAFGPREVAIDPCGSAIALGYADSQDGAFEFAGLTFAPTLSYPDTPGPPDDIAILAWDSSGQPVAGTRVGRVDWPGQGAEGEAQTLVFGAGLVAKGPREVTWAFVVEDYPGGTEILGGTSIMRWTW